MQRLIDSEIASNNGGWQWSASTGTDAAPLFPHPESVGAGEAFDPDGEYIRRWVPELRDVHSARFSVPPLGGTSVAPGYPRPDRRPRPRARGRLGDV
jgi:deoxyribodipyrimidine photo-lyase